MKPFTEIYTEEDIDALFTNRVEENPRLEFKAAGSYTNVGIQKISDETKLEITRDVSAFANAEGGIIIYGVEEINHVAERPSFIDGNKYTKERLEQLIADKLQGSFSFTIDVIRTGGDLSKSIYVVRIPASDKRPHMAADGKFYKRGNFRKVQMQEYEVRDSFNRQTTTELEILPTQVEGKIDFHRSDTVVRYAAMVSFRIKNVGKVVEKMHTLEVQVPRDIVKASYLPKTVHPFFQKRVDSRGHYEVYSFSQNAELFPGQEITVASTELMIVKENFPSVQADPIKIKLYYSSGTREDEIFLIKDLKHKDHPLGPNCFLTDDERELLRRRPAVS